MEAAVEENLAISYQLSEKGRFLDVSKARRLGMTAWMVVGSPDS